MRILLDSPGSDQARASDQRFEIMQLIWDAGADQARREMGIGGTARHGAGSSNPGRTHRRHLHIAGSAAKGASQPPLRPSAPRAPGAPSGT